jgi:hypothetical protein
VSGEASAGPALDDKLRVRLRGRELAIPDLVIVAAALLWLAVVLVATRSQELIASDDAFISFQYARNLARGHGLVFNPGERVWGFTSPLQTLLLGGLATLGCDTIRAAFVAGFLWVAVGAVLLHFVAAKLLPRTLACCLGLYFLLDASQHGSYAMESGLLVGLQLGFLLAVARGRGRWAAVLAGLSCLARPDSVLLVLPILIAGRETRRPVPLACFAGIGVLWEGFAYATYGALVPNSLAAKSGLSHFGAFFANAFEHVAGVTFAAPLASQPSTVGRVIVVVLGVLPLLNARVRRRFAWSYGFVLYPWVLLVAYAAIGSFQSHVWEFYSAKLFLRVAAGVGLLSLAGAVAAHLRPRWRWTGVALAAGFAVTNGLAASRGLLHDHRGPNHAYWSGARNATYRQIANWVNTNLPRGETIALSEVGTFAYYTDMKVVDVSGIITRGYRPSERMNHDAFLLRFAPRYAVLYGNRRDIALSRALRYRRLAYFPKQGFEDFSLMVRE